MTQVVVDASTALKWVLEEPGTEAALRVLDEDVIHAPDFLLVEVANVLWAKARRGVLTRAGADAAFEAVAAVPIAYAPLGELTSPARSLAFALDVTLYDALYAALAQRFDCPLVTADVALANAINASGMAGSARLIG
jgi:predicted nucleic acid-binding protein